MGGNPGASSTAVLRLSPRRVGCVACILLSLRVAQSRLHRTDSRGKGDTMPS